LRRRKARTAFYYLLTTQLQSIGQARTHVQRLFGFALPMKILGSYWNDAASTQGSGMQP
jgi:hypothetical protein